MLVHTDASYLRADSILGELTFVHTALAAAGCPRVYASGDEEEALALLERERVFWTFRQPALGRLVHREGLRHA